MVQRRGISRRVRTRGYSLKEDWDWKDFHLYSYSPQCPRNLIRTTNLSTPYGQCQRLNSIFFNQRKEKEKNPTGFDIEHSLKCIRSTQAQRIFSKNLEFGVSEEVQGKKKNPPFWSNLRKLHYCNLRWQHNQAKLREKLVEIFDTSTTKCKWTDLENTQKLSNSFSSVSIFGGCFYWGFNRWNLSSGKLRFELSSNLFLSAFFRRPRPPKTSWHETLPRSHAAEASPPSYHPRDRRNRPDRSVSAVRRC